MKKVLAIFMAIAMIATMFSFTSVVFAEEAEETEKPVFQAFYGGQQMATAFKGTTPNKGWNPRCLNADSGKPAEAVLKGIKDAAASGDYSAILVTINAVGAYDTGIVFNGIEGTAETPVIFSVATDADGNPATALFEYAVQSESTEVVPSVTIKNCSYFTLQGISIKAVYTGLVIENCTNVTVDGIKFNSVSYTDYSYEIVVDQDTGATGFPKMETADRAVKGSAISVGEGNTDLTISNCSFEKCRVGINVDATDAEAESTGVKLENNTFTTINEAAVALKNANGVTVSGGSAAAVGDIALASDFDGRAVAAVEVTGGSDNVIEGMEVSSVTGAAVALNGAKNTTVQKMYSHDNAAFMTNTLGADANVRIRYNVSVNDGASSISTAAATDVLVYNNTFSNAGAIDMSNVTDLTVMNNIFSMAIGNKVVLGSGEFDANCYHWTSKAKGDSGSIKKNPQFANQFSAEDTANSVRDNYILSSKSPCLGKGVQVEDDMGETDFYGNAIGSSHNIGADEGTGAEATYKLVSQFVDTINYIFAIIKNFFVNLFG